MKKVIRVFAFSCVLAIIIGMLPVIQAAEMPESLEVMWDMEALPTDLYEGGIGWDLTCTYGGHAKGFMDATRADGKGRNGTTAAAITFTEKAHPNNLGANGICLRLDQDPAANTNWLGAEQYWFWMDTREFVNSTFKLSIMIDGVYPRPEKPYYLVQNGEETVYQTIDNGDEFGYLSIPNGFAGWVGIDMDAFDATLGVVQQIGFRIIPSGDWYSFPLSVYVDDISIVRGSESFDALLAEGDQFNAGTPAGEYQLYTNLTKMYQTVESYGASGAWWATTYGTEPFVDQMLKTLFTDEGAGLNNYRHNVGGSVLEDMSDAGNMGIRATKSPLLEDGSYDVLRDIGGYTVLTKLRDLGTIDDFTFFMNSPPSTMTKNGKTFADPDAAVLSNLREHAYEAYAKYVVDVVQLYREIGIPVKYVSPVNEPQYDWNVGNQEGCHYEPDETIRIIELIAAELLDRCEKDPSMEDVRISFAESGTWYDKNYINNLYWTLYANPDYSSKFAHIGAHSYAANAAVKEQLMKDLFKMIAKVNLRQTEFAYGAQQTDLSITSAVAVARVMHEDLSILNVDGWSFWLAGGNGSYSDALVYYNVGQSDVVATKRLWAMGQYARFTKGAIRVEADSYGMPENVFTTAYVDPKNGNLVYVIINDSGADQTFSLVGLPAGSVADVYETSAARSLGFRGTMTADAGYTLPDESITTLVFRDMDFRAVVSDRNPDNPNGIRPNKNFDYSVYDKKADIPVTDQPTEPEETEPAASTPSKQDPQPEEPSVMLPIIIALVVTAAVITLVLISRKKKG